MNVETVLKHCDRANSYKILAECFYLPNVRLLKILDDYEQATDECLWEVLQNVPKIDDLERYNIDYSKLFIGPFKLLASPYGSTYLEGGKFMGNSTLEVRHLYQQEGLDIVLKDAPDHISMELEFMYFLALNEAAARENSDLKQTACLRDKQAVFLRTHLGRWIEPFADNIEKYAQTKFYQALGRATRDFVLKDLDNLSADCELEIT